MDKIISEFSKLSLIEKYKFIEKYRDILREIQKLSYRITQFDKRFPFENIKEKDYEQILKVYIEFLFDAKKIINK